MGRSSSDGAIFGDGGRAAARVNAAAAWRQLSEHVAEGVALLDATDDRFTILEINGRCRQLLAGIEGELAGRPWLEAVAAAEARALIPVFQRVRERGEPVEGRDFVYPLPAAPEGVPTGGTAYWDWQCLPLREVDGGPIAQLLLVITDVTERRLAERDRRLQLRIIEESPIGVAVLTGPLHVVALANPRFAASIGADAADLSGHPLGDRLPAAAAGSLEAVLERVYRAGVPFSADDFKFSPVPDGDPRFWSLAVLPLPGDGPVEGLILMVADTTAHVRARRTVEDLALAAQRRAGQLEAIIGSMIDGVFILDAHGLVQEANEAAMRLLGLPANVRAQRLSEYLLALEPTWADGRSIEPGADLLAGVLAGEELPDVQLLIGPGERREREQVVSLSAAPVRESGGRISGAVVLVRDISAQKRADQEKDAFLSLISHEVKSPLTSIKGFSQLARRAAEQGHSGERVVRHLGVIEQQVERISRLVNDLSDAARIQRGALQQEPTNFDLAALARGVVEQQQVITASHHFALEIADEPLVVHADPARLEQVLTNLLTNAVKYSPDAARVFIGLARRDGFALLSVRDEGIGIPRAEQGQLFARFYRAPNAVSSGSAGLGLGLFITHELVVRNGGRIWVESEENQGSTFYVTVPLAAA